MAAALRLLPPADAEEGWWQPDLQELDSPGEGTPSRERRRNSSPRETMTVADVGLRKSSSMSSLSVAVSGSSSNIDISGGGSMRKSRSMTNIAADTFESDGSSSGCSGQWEVYTCYRGLRELSGGFYRSLPREMQIHLRDLGVCHYMTLLRSPAGEVIQFDFGPKGGDITLQGSSRGGRRNKRSRRVRKGEEDGGGVEWIESSGQEANGEIREERLDCLPPTALFVGHSRHSIERIREFNRRQNLYYGLNENDCRHYVDTLVRFTTGQDKASARLMRHTLQGKLSSRRDEEGSGRGPWLRQPLERITPIIQLALEKESSEMLARAVSFCSSAASLAAGIRISTVAAASARGLLIETAAKQSLAGGKKAVADKLASHLLPAIRGTLGAARSRGMAMGMMASKAKGSFSPAAAANAVSSLTRTKGRSMMRVQWLAGSVTDTAAAAAVRDISTRTAKGPILGPCHSELESSVRAVRQKLAPLDANAARKPRHADIKKAIRLATKGGEKIHEILRSSASHLQNLTDVAGGFLSMNGTATKFYTS